MWNYLISKGTKIEHIEWIASTRVFAYTLEKQVPKKEDEKEKTTRKNSNSTSKLNKSNDNLDNESIQLYTGTSFPYFNWFKISSNNNSFW